MRAHASSASAGGGCTSPSQCKAANAVSLSSSRVRATALRPSMPSRMLVVSRKGRIVGPPRATASSYPSARVLPAGVGPAVVEHRLAVEHDVDLALDAADRTNQHVLGLVVPGDASVVLPPPVLGPRPHEQRVANDQPAGACLPRGLEHVGARQVAATGGHQQLGRAQAERSCPSIEDGAEDAGAVGAGQAEPFDAAAGAHQRAHFTVGQERVLCDRWERAVAALQRRHVAADGRVGRGARERDDGGAAHGGRVYRRHDVSLGFPSACSSDV